MCPDLRRVKKTFAPSEIELPVPEGKGRLHVSARLLYRKVDQYLLNFMFGDKKALTAPVTEMASATRMVEIESALTD